MNHPFLVLDVPSDATDEQVRAAYQSLLRRYPPEHHPERFQMIQEAYQALRTARDRRNWQLLHLEESAAGPLEKLEAFARLPGRMNPPGAGPFRSLLRSCAASALRTRNSTTRPKPN